MEKWITIKNYPNYKISNKGRVLSFKNDKINGELLEPRKVSAKLHKEEKYGYYVRVSLQNEFGSEPKYIHKMVAEAFIPNPNNYPCVNHINGIKNDNRVENLEWCDYAYNSWHSCNVLHKDLYGNSETQRQNRAFRPIRERGIRKKREKKRVYEDLIIPEEINLKDFSDKYAVIAISKYGEILKAFHSPTDAANLFSKGNSAICACCNRKENYNMAYGYIWRYIKDFDINEFESFRNKRVTQFTEWGIKIKEYDDLIIAAKENDYCILNLIDCLNGVVDTAYFTKWCFSENYEEITTNKWKPIVQMDIHWNYIKEYSCMTNASKDNDTAFISRIYESCVSKGNKTSGGFRWMYKDDYVECLKNKKE